VDFRYRVYAYSSFHFAGDAEKYFVGEFGDCASAVAVCEKIVDDFLSASSARANSPEALLEEYESSGPEPFIESEDPECRFSAIHYVHRRVRTRS
jgi:hypothetical protein